MCAIFTVASLCILAPAPSYAWREGGHWIVASLAYDRLTPHTRAIVSRLLLVPIPPEQITSESAGDFVRASVWADLVKREPGFARTAGWHYIDNPFADPPGTPIPPHLVGTENLIMALHSEIAILRNPKANLSDRAQSLRFLIHFVGDIHQPLHCATRVSPLDPEGDRGGTEFSLSGPDRDLHILWDTGLDSFPTTEGNVPSAAARISREFPDSDPSWKKGGVANFEEWMEESVSIARTLVYEGIQRSAVPPRKYLLSSARVADKRVAWAGYRLALLLNTLFASQKD